MIKLLSLRGLPSIIALPVALAFALMLTAKVAGTIIVLEQYRDVRNGSEKIQADGFDDFDATLEQPLAGYVHQKSTFGPLAIEGILEIDSPDLQQGWSSFEVKFRIDRPGRYGWHNEVSGNALGPDSVTSAVATFSSAQGAMVLAQGTNQAFYLDRGDYSIQADASARFGSSRVEFFLRSVLDCDANFDGKVSLTDFGLMKATFGQRGFGLPADFNGDGAVNLSDLGLFKQGIQPSVPEPSTWLLAALAGLGLAAVRPRGLRSGVRRSK